MAKRFIISGEVGKMRGKYRVELRLNENRVIGDSSNVHGALVKALKALAGWYGQEHIQYSRMRRRLRR